jgi:hypothetical protein
MIILIINMTLSVFAQYALVKTHCFGDLAIFWEPRGCPRVAHIATVDSWPSYWLPAPVFSGIGVAIGRLVPPRPYLMGMGVGMTD